MYWEQWLAKHKMTLQSTPGQHEWNFARAILPNVRGLKADNVFPQHPFAGSGNHMRRMDFALLPAPGVQIAIELDGWDKTGAQRGMDRTEFEEFIARGTDLTAQGWILLRFTVRRAATDPMGCARTIELALRKASSHVAGAALSGDEEAELSQRLGVLESELPEPPITEQVSPAAAAPPAGESQAGVKPAPM